MAKYVPDIKTQRWVVLAPGRTSRPDQEDLPAGGNGEPAVCPFCVGNEHLTPPEVYRIGPGEKDKPGWEVRVVPNKYPITDIHEVIVHGPSCDDDIERLPVEQVAKILTCYRDRFRAHEHDGQVLIFCNHGMHAGASLKHPHSQLVVVPRQINLDALSNEPVNNVVLENTHYITYCPDFSQWPFEKWIAPKVAGGAKFSDIADADLPDLAEILHDAMQSIEAIYNDTRFAHIHAGTPFGYNYYISHAANWFIRIIPRFIHRAGFELGTGLSVNVMDPINAAEYFKKVARATHGTK